MQPTLERWVKPQNNPKTPNSTSPPNRVVTLFDRHSLAALAWAKRGFECTAFDEPGVDASVNTPSVPGVNVELCKLQTPSDILCCLGDLSTLAFVVALPPCTDLCAAGARWWSTKRLRDAEFQTKASSYLKALHKTLVDTRVKFCILVPSSPAIQRCFRTKPFRFSPHEFGGYQDPASTHPLFKDQIPARDAYTKRTLCYHSRGIKMPWKKAVVPQFRLVKLKSGKTKRLSPIMAKRGGWARSVPPLAFCGALASANA